MEADSTNSEVDIDVTATFSKIRQVLLHLAKHIRYITNPGLKLILGRAAGHLGQLITQLQYQVVEELEKPETLDVAVQTDQNELAPIAI